MKRLAIFGGAFNPPTIAHQQLADYISTKKFADEVWLMPCYKHKFRKQMVAFEHRYNMCKYLRHLSIQVSEWEERHKPDGTLEMIELLSSQYAQATQKPQLLLVVGQDNADEIEKWKNWKKLIETVNFIVFPRNYKTIRNETKNKFTYIAGEAKSKDKKIKAWYATSKRHIFLRHFKANSISSSMVRKLLMTKDETAKDYLNPNVYKYIEENELYV